MMLSRFTRLSGGGLLLAMMLVCAVPAALLSGAVLDRAKTSELQRIETVAGQLLQTLRDSGQPELRAQIRRAEQAVLSGSDRAEVALWRHVGSERVLQIETREGLAQILAILPPGTRQVVTFDGTDYLAAALDIGRRSEDWGARVTDLELVVALPHPSPDRRAASDTVLAIWVGFGLALGIGLILHLHHRQRYGIGLQRIASGLNRFADGELSERVPPDPPAPELLALSTQLNQVLDRLDELIEGINYFSAELAHELKSPITRLQQLLGDLKVAPEQEAQVLEAKAKTDAALAIYEEIMKLFKLEARRTMGPPDEIVDLSQLLSVQMEDYEDFLQTDARTLEAQIEPGLMVRGSETQLIRVVVNLMENARKYAPNGAKVSVALSASDGRFRLSVANTGKPFPEDVRTTAFKRFVQGRVRRVDEGVGLGLPMVRAIVNLHGFKARIVPSDRVAEVEIVGPLAIANDKRDQPDKSGHS